MYKANIKKLKEDTDTDTIIVGDFNTVLFNMGEIIETEN